MSNIRNNKYITIQQLAEATNKSTPTISRHLSSLTNMHIIKRVGSKKSGYWHIND